MRDDSSAMTIAIGPPDPKCTRTTLTSSRTRTPIARSDVAPVRTPTHSGPHTPSSLAALCRAPSAARFARLHSRSRRRGACRPRRRIGRLPVRRRLARGQRGQNRRELAAALVREPALDVGFAGLGCQLPGPFLRTARSLAPPFTRVAVEKERVCRGMTRGTRGETRHAPKSQGWACQGAESGSPGVGGERPNGPGAAATRKKSSAVRSEGQEGRLTLFVVVMRRASTAKARKRRATSTRVHIGMAVGIAVELVVGLETALRIGLAVGAVIGQLSMSLGRGR